MTPHPDKPFSVDSSSNWLVTGVSLAISFHKVFLRLAQGTETNIVLTADFFAKLAIMCWDTNKGI